MEPLNQRHETVRPAVAVDIDVVGALIFQRSLMHDALVEGIAADQDRDFDMARLNGVGRAAHAGHATRPSIVSVQHPIQFQAKLLSHMRRIIGTRLGGYGEPLNIALFKPGLTKGTADGLGIIPEDWLLGLS